MRNVVSTRGDGKSTRKQREEVWHNMREWLKAAQDADTYADAELECVLNKLTDRHIAVGVDLARGLDTMGLAVVQWNDDGTYTWIPYEEFFNMYRWPTMEEQRKARSHGR